MKRNNKKMLLVGDSISLHYGTYLNEYIKHEYEIYSKPGREEALKKIDKAIGGNGGDSSMVLEYIKERQEASDLDFDVFLFNCGLHDIKRKIPEENLQISMEEYEKNLTEIYEIMSLNKVKCIFMTTTPVLEDMHNTLIPAGIKRYNKDVLKYNEIAIKVANKYNASIIDLHRFVCSNAGEIYIDYAHFDSHMRKLQAAFIAGAVMSME